MYPDTRICDATDELAGITFPDPYRWLEQDSEEVRRWQHTQAEIASEHVRAWPDFDRLRCLVERFTIEWYRVIPKYSASRWFRTEIAQGATQARVLVSDEPMGAGRALFDPMSENCERPPFVSWISPSPDGRTLALGLCVDGSENNAIRLIDVDSGRALPDPPTQVLMDNTTDGVQWLPDSSGFFFSAIGGSPARFEQSLFLHRRAAKPSTVRMDVPWTCVKDYRWAVISRDGRYAVAFERGTNPIPVAIAELSTGDFSWKPFVTLVGATVAGHVLGDSFIAVTDVGAPRGRVVRISLDCDDPNDPRCWEELVAESNATLRSITPVGSVLYLAELVDTYTRIRMIELDGRHLGDVQLPFEGALGLEWLYPMLSTFPKGHPERFLFTFSSLTVSPGVYSHQPGKLCVTTLKEPKERLDAFDVEDRWAVSIDGTRVPYHVVKRADVPVSQPQPTLICAYGGNNVPILPEFPGPMTAFVAAGGVYVQAHLRGGGEFGLEWWLGGKMRNKQNSYDDLFAVAEDLISRQISSKKLLAVTGLSNGGLMAGVAITQRPDLWGVVVPRVPVLDLIGACRYPYGRMATLMERANVEEPDEVQRLATFSPYHLVSDGTCYPAVYIDAGDTDPRCPPWHARKFAARLQRATSGGAPVLLHVWENVGHGFATDRSTAVLEYTEWLAFTAKHLGLKMADV